MDNRPSGRHNQLTGWQVVAKSAHSLRVYESRRSDVLLAPLNFSPSCVHS
jgi:hypothetical protein